MNVLFILNDEPNEAGRSINALRLACSLSMRSSVYVRIFLVGASVAWARSHPESQADSGRHRSARESRDREGRQCPGPQHLCRRGRDECQGDACLADLIAGTTQSSLTELSRRITEADQVPVF